MKIGMDKANRCFFLHVTFYLIQPMFCGCYLIKNVLAHLIQTYASIPRKQQAKGFCHYLKKDLD